MSWVKYLGIFVFSIIFAFSLINFVYNIELANNAPTNLLNDPSMSSFNSSMQGYMNSFSTSTTDQQNATLSEQVTAPTGAFILFSILTSIGRFITTPIRFVNSLMTAISINLGIPTIITETIAAFALLVGIFLWYKTVKQG